MDFSKTIKELRGKKHLTQRELAKTLGISYVQLNRYEKGMMIPRPPIIAKLAEALQVDYSTLSDLIPDTGTNQKELAQKPDTNSSNLYISATHIFEELSYKEQILFAFQINNTIIESLLKN